MSQEFEAKIIQDFAGDVGRKIGEAAVLVNAMEEFHSKGLPDRAFQSLLEIEPLIYEVATLINASSIVRRRGRLSDYG